MSEMNEIIYFTRFLPNTDRGGGSRRMMQIWEILKELNKRSEAVSTQRGDHLSKETLERINQNITPDMLDNEQRLWSDKRRKAVYRLHEISREWCRYIEETPQLKMVVLDEPIYFLPLFERLKHCGIPVIAASHNLETLAPSQLDKDPARTLFNKEIDLLAQCDLVVTISREENFLLHNLGINTVFFPYYPTEPILSRLIQVREKRKKTEKKGIFLLGNAFNVQTREGMIKMIDFWHSSRLFRKQGELIVGGYGTEKYLKDNAGRSGIEFLGDLTNEALDSRLSQVKACLCFQERGSGALTRICEMLIAGLPVLANSHAARSYYNRDGVIEFSELEDLEGALKQVKEWSREIQIPPAPKASRLISRINKIIMNGQLEYEHKNKN